MATMSNFSAKVFAKNLSNRSLPFSRSSSLSQPRSSGSLRFRRWFSVNLNRKIKPVPALNLTSDNEVSDDSEDAEKALERERTLPRETIHVKFQLKKQCNFGDQYYVVGDNPMLGSWDTENAVPLTWSDGHFWTAEMDVPIGIAIRFKFILKPRVGDFIWQPGPDRVFRASRDSDTTVISDDWENSDLQEFAERNMTDEMSEQELKVRVSENDDATMIGDETLEQNPSFRHLE